MRTRAQNQCTIGLLQKGSYNLKHQQWTKWQVRTVLYSTLKYIQCYWDSSSIAIQTVKRETASIKSLEYFPSYFLGPVLIYNLSSVKAVFENCSFINGWWFEKGQMLNCLFIAYIMFVHIIQQANSGMNRLPRPLFIQ